jgi:hypothetical protein
MALGGCGPDGSPRQLAAQPRGATVAFDSIDGPPPAKFDKLVQDLNAEAHARRLAVTSRKRPAAYRVRGYLTAQRMNGKTTISWVWDVFGREQQRALRITGAATTKTSHYNAWSAADDAMLKRIAHSSMDELAAFLTSPAVALVGHHDVTPEEAGIFRIFKPQAGTKPEPKAEAEPNLGPKPARRKTAAVPLPPRRPTPPAAISSRETVALAVSSRAAGR